MKLSNPLVALVFSSASFISNINAYKGDATYYYPGLGACGRVNKASELVVALPAAKYGKGSHCFKKVGIHYKGKYVKATIVDECPGCGSSDLDISPSAFSHLADKDLGRIEVDWEFL